MRSRSASSRCFFSSRRVFRRTCAFTSAQIADARSGNYLVIIDNVHNPVGAPLAEAAPNATYLVWRNFPENVGHDSLEEMVEDNIELLTGAFGED